MKVSIALAIGWTLATLTGFAANLPAVGTNPTVVAATNEVIEPDPPGKLYTNSIGMELVQVPGGFWAGKFEVTQKEYQKITDANPSAFAGAAQPVENINWNNAVAFCEKLTALDVKEKSLAKGYYYTLPTEDEWSSLVGDATLENAITSLTGARRESPAAIGTQPANNLGLFDVRGNVMEFTLGDPTQNYRVLKGGSWRDFVDVNLRPEFRWYCTPDETKDTFGMRVILKAR